jgi:hypothetical protein
MPCPIPLPLAAAADQPLMMKKKTMPREWFRNSTGKPKVKNQRIEKGAKATPRILQVR